MYYGKSYLQSQHRALFYFTCAVIIKDHYYHYLCLIVAIVFKKILTNINIYKEKHHHKSDLIKTEQCKLSKIIQ